MPCVLCLKDTNGRHNRIDFSSSKAEELDIKATIDLHFWRQIKEDPDDSECICKPCWGCLSTFHKYYLTIENAHMLLMESVAQSNIELNEIELPKQDLTTKAVLDRNVSPEEHVESTYSDSTEDSEDNRKKTRRLSKRKSKRTTKESPPNKKKKTTEKNSSKKLLNCDICDASITDMAELMLHNKTMHKDERFKKRTCTICSKIKPHYDALQAHVKYAHNTERKHQCTECDKAFKFPLGLREHMATHTGEKLYTCPHCPKTFNSNANMHSHRKKMHRAEWEANRRCWVYVGTDKHFLDSTESENSN